MLTVNWCDHVSIATRKLLYDFWRNVAGPELEMLLDSREYALRQLESESIHLQIAALSICHHHWHCRDDNAFQMRCLALLDPMFDCGVRCVAASALGFCFEGTRNSRAQITLAAVVLDKHSPSQLSHTAICAMHQIEYAWSGQLAIDLLFCTPAREYGSLVAKYSPLNN